MARAQVADPLRARTGGYRKRLARRLGVRLSEVDSMTWEAIEVYCRCKAVQSTLDPTNDAERALRATNATGRAWAALERRLRDVGLDGKPDAAGALAAHVAERYGERNGA